MVEGDPTPTSGRDPAAQSGPSRLALASSAVALIVLALLLAAMAPLVGQIWGLRAWVVDSPPAYGFTGGRDPFPIRPLQGRRTLDLRQLPANPTGPLQISYLFQIRPALGDQPVLLAPVASGDITLFVNGARVRQFGEISDPYLANPAGRAGLWRIPPTLLRPGLNRIDLRLEGATGRSLRAPLVLGPSARLEPTFRAIAAATTWARRVIILLSVAAAGLALAAAVTSRSMRPWIVLSATAAAVGARAIAGDAFLVARLGERWSIVDLGLLAMALVCLGCAIVGAGPTPPERKLVTRGALALAAASSAAALAASSGWLWGLWPLGLEAAYGLGVIVLLAALAVVSAIAAAEAAGRLIRERIDLGRTIRRQQAEIQATSAALDQQMRRSAILEERQRLARDMHDGIGGQLASLLARVRTRRISLDQMEDELSGGLSELRLLVDSLDAVGESLAEALAAFRARARTQVEAAGMTLVWEQPDGLDIATHDPRWILNLYRLLQETVTNAVRHSGGDQLAVRIERPDGVGLAITIEDNGSGYDPETITRGRGLANMAIRADQLGATLTSGQAAPGPGNRVRIDLTAPAGRSAMAG